MTTDTLTAVIGPYPTKESYSGVIAEAFVACRALEGVASQTRALLLGIAMIGGAEAKRELQGRHERSEAIGAIAFFLRVMVARGHDQERVCRKLSELFAQGSELHSLRPQPLGLGTAYNLVAKLSRPAFARFQSEGMAEVPMSDHEVVCLAHLLAVGAAVDTATGHVATKEAKN